jgi:ubiquinone/menaquinone biosynthesis C-methylase UbiE
MPDYQRIYRERAGDYDLLVSREDRAGNIAQALRRTRPLEGLDVVELGAGTGRLTRLLAAEAKSVLAFDNAPAMLEVARVRLEAEFPGGNWLLAEADNAALPCGGASADLAVAGWTFGHRTEWNPSGWRGEIRRILAEIGRVLRPGGEAVIFETLGTGASQPAPPSEALAEYYELLEGEAGFEREAIATDYGFASPEEAERLCRFFFGDALAGRVRDERLAILPEWTGAWRKRFA